MLTAPSPQLRSNDFYATGESYAGKYVPAVAYTIQERNKVAAKKINLKGIAIGDGAFDPPTQFTGFGPLLFNIGLADTRAKKLYDAYDQRFTASLAAGDRVAAFRSFDEMLNGDYAPTTFYGNTTGMGSNYFNFGLEPGAASLTKRTFPTWLAQPQIAAALHVGSVPYSVFNQTVEDRLLSDWVVGVVPMLQPLMDAYDVLIYSGQYDVILGPPGTERAIDKLKWSGATRYATVPTQQFTVGDDLAGYSREALSDQNTKFAYVMLRGCGHMVPTDQPVRAHEMIRRFLVPFAPLPPSASGA
uniref:Carboxypeptidase n=1 Tax=Haptolina ericina TaxID=156174 RepID=A0A7S3AIU6_9EUKA